MGMGMHVHVRAYARPSPALPPTSRQPRFTEAVKTNLQLGPGSGAEDRGARRPLWSRLWATPKHAHIRLASSLSRTHTRPPHTRHARAHAHHVNARTHTCRTHAAQTRTPHKHARHANTHATQTRTPRKHARHADTHARAPIAAGLWATVALWQQFLEQRAAVMGQKMQRDIQKGVVSYLKSNSLQVIRGCV